MPDLSRPPPPPPSPGSPVSVDPWEAGPRRRALALRCTLAREISSAVLGVPVEAIGHASRSQEPVCLARHVAMYLANVAFGVSLTAMAGEFGRDRTTCGHGVRRIEDRRDDPDFDALIGRLERLAALLDGALPKVAGAGPSPGREDLQ